MVRYLPISMSKSTLILVILVAILAAEQAAAQAPTTPTYKTEICRSKMGNYTTNSTYEANVISVLTNLYAQSSNASFANSSSGSALTADQVFGQFYCRYDINSSLCNNCIKEAAQKIYGNCHNFKSAVVWYEECTLRYDNISMVGVEAELPNSYAYSNTNVTNQDEFGIVVNETMAGLINEAVNAKFFATGEGVVSRFETVYCLVQCSPDLNRTECNTCLRFAYGELAPQWWPEFVGVFVPSCQMRYSTQGAFYQVQNAAPPPEGAHSPSVTPPSPSTPTPPVTTVSPPSAGGSAMLTSRESLNLGLVFSALILVLLRFG